MLSREPNTGFMKYKRKEKERRTECRDGERVRRWRRWSERVRERGQWLGFMFGCVGEFTEEEREGDYGGFW